MDPAVQNAMQRWPNVPAVYGWLSLDARGRWHLHEAGDAQSGGPGGVVTNAQLINFISRNYACDSDGNWFFQNGPQRVYVRVDAAPWVLRLRDGSSATLETHTGLEVRLVQRWLVDEQGRIFAQLPEGGAMVVDRDLAGLAELLCNPQGQPLLEWLEQRLTETVVQSNPTTASLTVEANLTPVDGSLPPAPLVFVVAEQVPHELGYVANPTPPNSDAL